MIIGITNITTLLIMIGIIFEKTKYISQKNPNLQFNNNSEDLLISCDPEDESKITQLIVECYEESEELIRRLNINVDETPIRIII